MEIPPETIIRFSRFKQFLNVLLAVFMIGLALTIILVPDKYFFTFGSLFRKFMGTMLILAGTHTLYIAIKNIMNRKIQIVINYNGLMTAGASFYSWKNISNAKVVKIGIGKNSSYHLQYRVDGYMHDFELSGFDIGNKKLSELLKLYSDGTANTEKESN
ncbi:hypothetical protein QF042_004934 [Pedobacter sp. W3I1]|uniref:hypothetical protein n=1 Tax=Pedobacter sp. W3I1 TaxID=3042291 RepID=UPI00278A497D|nr:hypothetical protein [Pedobacter sp. W3I1]MDQ0641369.1 hypothetical protein [Pedobacter sp. W3I1]